MPKINLNTERTRLQKHYAPISAEERATRKDLLRLAEAGHIGVWRFWGKCRYAPTEIAHKAKVPPLSPKAAVRAMHEEWQKAQAYLS